MNKLTQARIWLATAFVAPYVAIVALLFELEYLNLVGSVFAIIGTLWWFWHMLFAQDTLKQLKKLRQLRLEQESDEPDVG